MALSHCFLLASFLFESAKVAAAASDEENKVKTLPMRIFRLGAAVVVRRAMALVTERQVGQLQRQRAWEALDQTVCIAVLPLNVSAGDRGFEQRSSTRNLGSRALKLAKLAP